MTLFEIIVLSVVEGITEFLPISSTGHMIIASSLLGIAKNEFTKLFEVAIQLGAILSVVALYWRKFFEADRLNFYLKLIVDYCLPRRLMRCSKAPQPSRSRCWWVE